MLFRHSLDLLPSLVDRGIVFVFSLVVRCSFDFRCMFALRLMFVGLFRAFVEF